MPTVKQLETVAVDSVYCLSQSETFVTKLQRTCLRGLRLLQYNRMNSFNVVLLYFVLFVRTPFDLCFS